MPFNVQVEEVIPVLPAGVYQAYLGKIEEQSNDNGEFWLWTWVARNGDTDVEVTATTSPRITPKTKAAKWLAALGAKIDVGESLDLEAFYDTPCQIVIIINDQNYSRVDSVIPWQEPKGKAAKTA